MITRSLSRSPAARAVAAALAGLAIVAAPACRRFGQNHVLAARAGDAAAAPGVLHARIVVPGVDSRGPASLAETAGAAWSSAPMPPGIDPLLDGNATLAMQQLAAAARTSANVRDWTNLAAAAYEHALREPDSDSLLTSLTAASHALDLDPTRGEASFNLSLAVNRLGFDAAAAELWRESAALQRAPAWRAAALARVRALANETPANRAWMLLASRAPSLEQFAAASTRHPQQARLWAEAEALGVWADGVDRGDTRAAEASLASARAIAETLQRTSGESMLHDAVRTIDGAASARDSQRLRALVAGHRNYRRARQLYRDGAVERAKQCLQSATASLRAAGSPFADSTLAYHASVLHDSDQFDAATRELHSLLPRLDDAHCHYYGLRAQVHYQLARLHAIRGEWNDAFPEAAEAIAVYHQVNEEGNEGAATLLRAEAYDFIGQPSVAIREAIGAVALLARAGDAYRLRVCAAVLCRSFMRREAWDAARAFVRIEHALERTTDDAVVGADLRMREAIVDHHLGRTAASETAMRGAVATASQLPEGALRASMLADVRGAEGVLLRTRDPLASVQRLTEAIQYLESTDRRIQLPQMYLERGRSELRAAEPRAALADFDRGIACLERERSEIGDKGMRYGIFDDAHELFAEAVSLRLREGDAEGAFATIERGRARALIEQIAGEPLAARVLRRAAIRNAMPADALLIEFAILPDRIVAFAIARDLNVMRETRVRSDAVANAADVFVRGLSSRAPIADVQRASSELRDLLLGAIPEHRRYGTLIFVTDGTLRPIPFAALFDRTTSEYLVQRHVVAECPSARMFATTRASRPATGHRSAAVFVGARSTPAAQLRPLPEADREAGRVATRYPDALLLRGPDVTGDRFLAEAACHDVVHFCGHALIDPMQPSRSALVLAPRALDPSGLLACRRIGMARLAGTSVVVLAACSTMRGESGRVEGTPSIARSFLAAGVPAVIGTLWDVDDAETADLSVHLHDGLAAGTAPALALRAAQLDAMRSALPSARHPGNWAAFALLAGGSGAAVHVRESNASSSSRSASSNGTLKPSRNAGDSR